MSDYRHRGQILPIQNQMIPISKDTKFHASYDYGLHGFNQGDIVHPTHPERVLKFPTGNTFINCGVHSDFDIQNKGAFEFWAKSDIDYPGSGASDTAYRNIISKSRNGATGNTSYLCDWTGTGTTRTLRIGLSNGSDTLSVNNFDFSRWRHLRFEWTGTICRLYIDGVLYQEKAQGGSAISMPEIPFYIGNGFGATSNLYSWIGDIAEVKLENGERVVGYWKLNEKEGPIAYDSSGNGHDGSWVGSMTSTYGHTVATLKKEEGRFGGAVLVEEATRNLMYGKTPSFSAGLTSGTDGNGFYIMRPSGLSTTWVGVSAPNIPIPQGGTYTFSMEYMSDINFTWSIDNNDYSDNYTGNDATRASQVNRAPAYTTPGEWQQASITATMKADALNPKGAALFAILATNPVVDHKIYVRNFQFELKKYPTSFVENTRPIGRVSYPPGLIDWTKPWTVSMWAKFQQPSSVDSRDCVLWAAHYQGSTNNALHLLRRGAGELAIGFYGDDLNTTSYINDTNWHHYSFIWDGAKQIIYQDGKKVAERTAKPLNKEVNTVPHGINMYSDPAIQAPNALFDEIRIEQRAISEEEVQAWAASGLHYNYLDYSHYVD